MALKIRQEINIIDLLNSTTGSGSSFEAVQLDTTQYVNPTYYFEVIADSSVSLAWSISLRNSSNVDDAVCNIPLGTTTFTRIRSSAFTPPVGQTQYRLNFDSTTGATKNVRAARIIIIDNPTTLTSTETQIEIGSRETNLTNATAGTPQTSPKYWLYTAANWDGTKTFFAEVVYSVASSKSGITIILQEDNGSFASWTTKVTIISGGTATITGARVRSAAFTPTDGRHYRIAYNVASSKSAGNIYSAKIVVDQVPTTTDTQLLSGFFQNVQGTGATTAAGSSFVPSTNYTLYGIQIPLSKTGSPADNVYVNIVSGSISGTVIATSNNFPAAGVTSAGILFQTFTFPSPVALTGGTTYYIQVFRTGVGDTSNYTSVTNGVVTGPTLYQYNGTTWSVAAANSQFEFKTITAPSITLLEAQYLLLNANSTTIGLQSYQTLYDPTNEWVGVTNVYKHALEGSGAEIGELDDIDNVNAVVTNSNETITAAQQTITAALTMPTSGHQIDTNYTTKVTALWGSRILIAVTVSTGATVNTKTFTADGIIKATTTTTITSDGIVKVLNNILTFTANGIVKQVNTSTFTVDGDIFATNTVTFTSDGVIKVLNNTKTLTTDGIIKVTTIFTFTSDGIIKASTLNTFTTNGIIKATTNFTFTTDGIIKVLNNLFTFTTDGFIKVITTFTFTSDGIVLTTTTKTFTSDGLILATTTKTFTTDGIIKATIIKTFTTDGIVDAKTTLTFTTDGIVDTQGVLKTITADGIVKATTLLTLTSDGIVKALNNVFTFTADGLVRSTFTITFTADGLIRNTFTKTFTIDGIVKATILVTFTTDGIIATTFKTFTADAIIKEVRTVTFTADGVVKVFGNVFTFTSDGVVKVFNNIFTFTADGIVNNTFTKTFTSDGVVRDTLTKTFTVDAIVNQTKTFTFTTDGLVRNTLTKTFTTDGIVKATTLLAFTSDAVVKVLNNLSTFTVDGIVKDTKTITFTTDGLVLQRIAISFTIDAIIGTTTLPFTIDALVKQIQSITFTVDAIITAASSKTFTIDGIVDAKGTTFTFTIDGIVKVLGNIFTFTSGGLVKDTLTQTFTVDGIVKDILTKTITLDGVVKTLANTLTFTTDGIIFATNSKSITADGIVKSAGITTLTLDGIIKSTQLSTFTADGLVRNTFTQTFTADGIVKTLSTLAFTTDGLVKIISSTTVTLDGIVKAQTLLTFTIDGIVKVLNNTQTITLDGTISSSTTKTFTVDGMVKQVNLTLPFTTDGYIVSTKQFTIDSLLIRATSDYSRTAGALPTDALDLPTLFTDTEYDQVSVDDGTKVDLVIDKQVGIFEFKNKNTQAGNITVKAVVYSTIAPLTNLIVLQIFNRNTSSWETLSSNNTAGVGEKVTLLGTQTLNTANYYDANLWATCRVYQDLTL